MGVKKFIWDELSDNVLLETDENDVVTASYLNRPEPFGELLSQRKRLCLPLDFCWLVGLARLSLEC